MPDGHTRTRARRGTLSRTRIAHAALELVDTAGMSRLTMPNLAGHLGVGTMSLYRHITNKADLLTAMEERVFDGLTVPAGGSSDWQSRVIGYLLEWRQRVGRHPAMTALLAQRGLTFPGAREHLEELLTIMRSAGFGVDGSIKAFYTLYVYVAGFVLWELQENRYSLGEQPVDEPVDEPAAPPLSSRVDGMPTRRSSEQFRHGLDLLVGAIAQESNEGQASDDVGHQMESDY